jgi:hypothetical protein
MPPAIIRKIAGQQALNDVERLGQALVPLNPARPTRTDYVLIEALAAAKSQCEAVVAEQRQRRGALRHDGGMVAHCRAGHGRHQADPMRRICNGSQHRPGQRGMALLLEPGKVVIGNGREVEAGRFGTFCVAHQIDRAMLFRHELVTEPGHGCLRVASLRDLAGLGFLIERAERPKVRASMLRLNSAFRGACRPSVIGTVLQTEIVAVSMRRRRSVSAIARSHCTPFIADTGRRGIRRLSNSISGH